MGKIIFSLIAGAIITLMLRGTIIIDLTSLAMVAGIGALAYYVCFVEIGGRDEVEILEEYKREPEDPEDPEEILP